MEKQYLYQTAEKAAQQLWEQEQTYQIAAESTQPLYSIDTPPPTVSGSLHIGHVFSYTQTDIIARYKRMQGYRVFYPFGFDDNGLPTERFVEKKHNVKAQRMKRSEFIALCLQETQSVEKEFEQLWQSLGLSADFTKPYSTISRTTQKISQESFIRLYQDGHIYRKYEPALYCTTCQTSVAQAELDDAEKSSFFNDIAFHDADDNELIIGTTRPELLPNCVALLYHPGDSRYNTLAGRTATVPLFGHTVPLIADELVDPAKGTGLVMCCTFGDKTDILWYKKHNLPYRALLTHQGIFAPEAGIVAGQTSTQARETIITALQEQGLVRNRRAITHTVNVHERCKKEIEYIALSQWFLRILDHKEQFIALADKITWYPEHMKSRYINWVENLQWDWCLSRQRFFGIPFPVWHCADCHAILTPPVDALPLDPQETSYPGGKCTQCGSKRLAPDTDVMDTWNTSSITPYLCAQLYNPEAPVFGDAQPFIPMSMRPQAHDIIRTWAFYTIIKTWFHHRTIAWHDIVISGHVLASSKEKLSKSKGNSPFEPQTLLSQYPADVIRYWTASATLGTDIAFSDTPFKLGNRLLTKLWNALRFMQLFLTDIPAPAHQPTELGMVNEWILTRATTTFVLYQKYLDQYEFKLALDTVEPFFWHDLCDNYLELIKDQLFNKQNYAPETVAATAWTLHHVGLRILQWYAPYLPHITETIYQSMYRTYTGIASLHQTTFAAYQIEHSYEGSSAAVGVLVELIGAVRKLKTSHKLALSTELATLTINAPKATADVLRTLEPYLKGIARARVVQYADAATESTMWHEADTWHTTITLTPQ